jgi:hypothetical protein
MILPFALAAAAQDMPRIETFLGYQYVRASSRNNIPAFSANGGDGQLVYNFNSWLGGVADLGAVHNGNIGSNQINSTFMNFLFGPRFTFRFPRLIPYLQVLWGGTYETSSTEILATTASPNSPLYVPQTSLGQETTSALARITANQTAFALQSGGGLDIKINRHISFRPIELDYYMTRLKNLRAANDNHQNNLKYLAGVNFTFGAQ